MFQHVAEYNKKVRISPTIIDGDREHKSFTGRFTFA